MANTIALTKHSSRVLRWLVKALSKEPDRPVLRNVNLDSSTELAEVGAAVACDGFRLHATPLPPALAGVSTGKSTMIRLGKIPAGGGSVPEPEHIQGTYPDWRQIVPTGKPEYEIALDGKLLAEAVSGMTGQHGHVLLRFRKPHDPVEILGTIESKEGETSPAYAVIASVRLPTEYGGFSTWRPIE